MAALRSVPGAETMDQERSLSDVANEIAHTYHGMMIAIPEDEWRVFSRMRPAEMVATLREWAQNVSLKAYRKSPRGPKKLRLKHEGTTEMPFWGLSALADRGKKGWTKANASCLCQEADSPC